MTPDFMMGQLRLILVAVISFAVGKGWVTSADASALTQIAQAATPLIVVWGWSLATNWQKKYVPAGSVAIDAEHVLAGQAVPGSTVTLGNIGVLAGKGPAIAAKVIGCLIALILTAPLITSALAADNLPAQSVPVAIGCTPTSCSGPYLGGSLGGAGSNLDVIGSGLNNSVFAGGGLPMVQGGYQFANGTWFFAGEAGGGYQVSTKATVGGVTGGENGFLFYEIVKVGGNLSSLLGNQSSPITVPASLTSALISGYFLTGAVERQFASGWATGAGAVVAISPHSFIDIKYMYVNYGPSSNGAVNFNSENLLIAGFNYKF